MGSNLCRRSEGARHDPGGRHRDGMLLVGGERVPDNQLPVLRGRHQVPLVRAPVDAEDLGAVALEAPPDLDVQALDRLNVLCHLKMFIRKTLPWSWLLTLT